MSKFIPSIISLFYFSIFSQTTISGDISGMTFKSSGNPWIVKENIFVATDGMAVVKPGCIFLFKPYTGIVVSGTLEVEGLHEMPVVFTSVNDSSFNEASAQKAEPFDWNGIIIEKTAETVQMTDFILSYSVYGLKSKKEDVVLERGIFRQNGQFHFTINDKIKEVESNLPFNYSINEKPLKLPENPSIGWIKPVGTGTIIAGTIFSGIMAYFLYSANGYNKKYENTDDKGDINQYMDKRDDAVKTGTVTGIAGAVLVPTGIGLLLWEHKTGKSKTKVSVYSVTGETNGFTVAVNF
jgi:hypothetical protein